MSQIGFSRSAMLDTNYWNGVSDNVTQIVHSPSQLTKRILINDTDITIYNKDHIGIILCLTETSSTLLETDGHEFKVAPRIGNFGLLAPGQSVRAEVKGKAQYLVAAISLSSLRSALEKDFEIDGNSLRVETQFNKTDAVLERIIYRLASVDKESADSLALLFIGQIIKLSSQQSLSVISSKNISGLTPYRLRCVLNRIEDELELPLSLTTLADTVGMSAFHFSRQFKISTGLPPHQYVNRRRVDRAINLMISNKQPIETIAYRVGFNRASHLARHMRRITGFTASAFHRQVLGRELDHEE